MRLYILLSFVWLLCACDLESNIDYEITNETSEGFELIVEFEDNYSDTMNLDINERYTFYNYRKTGPSSCGTLNNLDSLRFLKDIQIKALSGKSNKNDLKSIDQWELIYPEPCTGTGIVRKTITDDDLH